MILRMYYPKMNRKTSKLVLCRKRSMRLRKLFSNFLVGVGLSLNNLGDLKAGFPTAIVMIGRLQLGKKPR